jgi:hypothetical protein
MEDREAWCPRYEEKKDVATDDVLEQPNRLLAVAMHLQRGSPSPHKARSEF